MTCLKVKSFKNSDIQPSKRTRNPRQQAMMAWETLNEPLEEQEEIETIDNLEIQFELMKFMKKNTKFNMKKIRALHLRMMTFHILNHHHALQIVIWNKKGCEDNILLYAILLKILESGIHNPTNRKEQP